MENSAVLCGAVQCSIDSEVQRSAEECSAVEQHGAVRRSVAWCGAVQSRAAQCGAVRRVAVWCNVMQCGVV